MVIIGIKEIKRSGSFAVITIRSFLILRILTPGIMTQMHRNGIKLLMIIMELLYLLNILISTVTRQVIQHMRVVNKKVMQYGG